MKRKINFGLALVFLVQFGNSCAGEPQTIGRPQKLVHNWEYISFRWTRPDDEDRPDFTISPSHSGEGSQGLRLEILNIRQGFDFFKTNSIIARLYRANGEVVEPTADGMKSLKSPISVSAGSSASGEPNPPQVMTCFPWGSNTLEESWIEVVISPERYWLEIPYGFDRNPTEPLPPSIPGGSPKFVPAMKSLVQHDHVLRWQNVQYDLGVIQNGWGLSLIQSNPSYSESEVVLYRDDSAVGKSIYLWDLHTPRTTLGLWCDDGALTNLLCTDIRLHGDGMRRSDTFPFYWGGLGNQRGWGQIQISVDDKSYWVVLPSSLYKNTHGHPPSN
jgi:hypothetical protein